MFICFAQNKGHYNRGQAFPFLVALIVILLILAMITINLGRLGIFKTEVSNAADAAALASVSVLSGALLGLGLRSDMMCGEAIVMVAAMVYAIAHSLEVVGIPVAVALYIAYIVSEITTYMQALEEGKMAWANAKKTALQYALQNVGVDEPRLTFQSFLEDPTIKTHYGISDPNDLYPEQLKNLYLIYTRGDDADAPEDVRFALRELTQGGFSNFMSHPLSGFAEAIGEIRPGRIAPPEVTTGYGWTQQEGGSFVNSFNQDRDYKNYDNWVEVKVVGNVIYPLEIYNLVEGIDDILDAALEILHIPWWLRWILNPALWIMSLIARFLDFLPAGLTMSMRENTDDNPLYVTVKRYKKGDDLGLWKFRYGTTQAESAGVAFRETGEESIEPVFFQHGYTAVGLIISCILGGGPLGLGAAIAGVIADFYNIFNTKGHLFESKLIYTQ